MRLLKVSSFLFSSITCLHRVVLACTASAFCGESFNEILSTSSKTLNSSSFSFVIASSYQSFRQSCNCASGFVFENSSNRLKILFSVFSINFRYFFRIVTTSFMLAQLSRRFSIPASSFPEIISAPKYGHFSFFSFLSGFPAEVLARKEINTSFSKPVLI